MNTQFCKLFIFNNEKILKNGDSVYKYVAQNNYVPLNKSDSNEYFNGTHDSDFQNIIEYQKFFNVISINSIAVKTYKKSKFSNLLLSGYVCKLNSEMFYSLNNKFSKNINNCIVFQKINNCIETVKPLLYKYSVSSLYIYKINYIDTQFKYFETYALYRSGNIYRLN